MSASCYRIPMKSRDIPREQQDAAMQICLAALAEVGVSLSVTWDDKNHRYVNDHNVDRTLLDKAGMLACDAVGIPYELVEVAS